jgi:4-carboxymuconolactone decarboxylase
MATHEERVEANQAFADRMRNGVGNLAAPAEVHDDWVDWVQASAFDAVWARPGLELRERSIATIAMLTALVRPTELAAHTRIGLRNGLSRQEIAEVVFQAGVYAGVPAAVEGMRVTAEVFSTLDDAS